MPEANTFPSPADGATARRVPWLRVALAGGLPLLVTLMLMLPGLRPEPRPLQGAGLAGEACLLGVCAQVLRIEGTTLACKADLLGVPYDCPARLLQPGAMKATWAALPSLTRAIGQARVDGVLLALERDGQKVFRRSLDQQVWQALYGGWVFHAIYWPLVALAWWWWPHTRIGRRLIRHATWDAGGPPGPRA